jgi:hypothetical protein
MRHLLCLAFAVPLLLLAAGARPPDDKERRERTPREQYQALEEKFRQAMAEAAKAGRAARTREDRIKAGEKVRLIFEEFGQKFLALARQHPQDPVAAEALAWVVSHYRSSTAEGRAAAEALIRYEGFLKGDGIGLLCLRLQNDGGLPAEKLLRFVMTNNPHQDVRGKACYALAVGLKNRAARERKDANREKLNQEADKLLERIIRDYGGVQINPPSRVTLGDRAKGALFAARHLGTGMTAPEIDGEDIEGKRFKLSDYRGKVVLLDFWGHW